MNRRALGLMIAAVLAAAPAACHRSGGDGSGTGAVTPDTHVWFPIAAGTTHALGRSTADGTMACESCHAPTNTSFKQFECIGCHDHEQTVTDLLHQSQADYHYESSACYSCHMDAAPVAFSHTGITTGCAQCHDAGKPFAALPVPGFTHPPTNGADCSNCHGTKTWTDAAGGAPVDSHDPMRDLSVAALIPTYAGTSITNLTPQTEILPQIMNHTTAAVDAAVLSACRNCHPNSNASVFYPGVLHASLDVLQAPQPTACTDCHAGSVPTGFVGPIDTSRSPRSGEMKHDAVLWNAGAPTATAAVATECGLCHQSPGRAQSTWAVGLMGTTPAVFHPALTAAGRAQPGSCLDCHANSRPTALLTSATAPGLPKNVEYDHASPAAMGDCSGCHTNATAMQGTSWAGGRFHLAGSATPKTCLPCHAGERPTSNAGWTSPTYTKSPFDYGTNEAGITHGDGQDCASCHNGPGTGAWGATPNWQGGAFAHGPGTASATTCIACHATQRPTTAVSGFDHTLNGAGDCFACHQATVTAGTYVNYTNPSTNMLPGGDWKGGQTYPGSVLASGRDQFVTVTEIKLVRSGANNLVTSTTSSVDTLFNGFLHTSQAIDARLSPGPASSPDQTTCWHCHTNNNGTVTAFANGKYHSALTAFKATPGGAVVPIPQPTSGCNDCHAQMRPSDIVEKAASDLQPMDHAAAFTAAVTIGGMTVSTVAQMDCSTCHKSSTGIFDDGKFHASIGTAVPKDCTACHYPVMADVARADLTSGVNYAMKHRSGQITFQSCQTCHTGALSKAAGTTITATSWAPGAFHPAVSPQPTACVDCHGVSLPAAGAPTQGSVRYALALGGTGSNENQWMNHGSSFVTGKDCVACHAADAKPSGSAWSKSAPFHATVTNATACSVCHGAGNGGGTAPGTNNNLPAGLTNSTTVTSAASDASTGIVAGTLDQIDHADVNVTGHDCSFCHTQAGPSQAAGVAGKEWAQAKFHAKFNAANPLTTNGTSGRCSNCHMNVKPGASFGGPDHTTFTDDPGTTDCSSCHSWPGAGGTASPNWLGATGGVPTVISVGGFRVPQPPAPNATTTQTGIANLPHPTVGSSACTSCHKSGGGARMAFGYDHASTLDDANCNACHEAGSDLVSPVWNGATTLAAGAGDTRPFTVTAFAVKAVGNTCNITNANHFYPADCTQCHAEPAGAVTAKTGTAYTTAWKFNHNETKMKGLCKNCHPPCPD